MRKNVAFVFPGQGSQAVGMIDSFLNETAEAAAYFARVDRLLEMPLTERMTAGPDEQLRETECAQPALLAAGSFIASELRARGVEPAAVAGHSLGEYTALACAGALSTDEALLAVRQRGLYMRDAAPPGSGAMAAVLGLDLRAVLDATARVSAAGELVQPANANCPGQIVISGTARGVQLASEQLSAAGARRIVALNVSGPFHSVLMEPAAERLRAYLASLDWREARIPVIANATAQAERNGARLRELAVRQMTAPVLWEESVRALLAMGIDTFIECGPGSVLSGLIRKIDRSAIALQAGTPAQLERAVEEVQKRGMGR